MAAKYTHIERMEGGGGKAMVNGQALAVLELLMAGDKKGSLLYELILNLQSFKITFISSGALRSELRTLPRT